MMNLIDNYVRKLSDILNVSDWSEVELLAKALLEAQKRDQSVYLCGNGGSAGNAIHLANDFLFGVCPRGDALRVEALSANSAVLTCLGNDIGYENIFSHQLKVKGKAGDLLIVLSGSGNSPNILNALKVGKQQGMQTFAILGYDGGEAKKLADSPIHFAVHDMQIAEDLQMIVGHMLMKVLNENLEAANE